MNMRTALAVCATVATAFAVMPGAAIADCIDARDWETFTNARFGMQIAVPVDCFEPQPPQKTAILRLSR